MKFSACRKISRGSTHELGLADRESQLQIRGSRRGHDFVDVDDGAQGFDAREGFRTSGSARLESRDGNFDSPIGESRSCGSARGLEKNKSNEPRFYRGLDIGARRAASDP